MGAPQLRFGRRPLLDRAGDGSLPMRNDVPRVAKGKPAPSPRFPLDRFYFVVASDYHAYQHSRQHRRQPSRQ